MSVAARLRQMAGAVSGSGAGEAPGAGDSRVVEVDGRRYAAELMWLIPAQGRSRLLWTVRQGRELGAGWCARRARQTGFWVGGDAELGGERLRTLAVDVAEGVGAGEGVSWKALVACAAGRYAVVSGEGEGIFPDGDRVFETLEEALGAFRGGGEWGAIYAPPGLVEGAKALRLGTSGKGCVVSPVPFGRAVVRRRAGVVAAVAVGLVALGFAGWGALKLYERWSRVELVEKKVKVKEVVRTGADVGRFLARCEAAMAGAPAMAPMWRRTVLQCKTDTKNVAGVEGRLDGGVLVSRWKLDAGANAAVWRRLAEERLARWDVGAVLVVKAWGAMDVEVVPRSWEGEQPKLREFRESFDRAVGALGVVKYGDGGKKGFRAVLRTRYPVAVVRARVEGIRWLDVTQLERDGPEWEFEFARVEPRTITKEVVRREQS